MAALDDIASSAANVDLMEKEAWGGIAAALLRGGARFAPKAVQLLGRNAKNIGAAGKAMQGAGGAKGALGAAMRSFGQNAARGAAQGVRKAVPQATAVNPATSQRMFNFMQGAQQGARQAGSPFAAGFKPTAAGSPFAAGFRPGSTSASSIPGHLWQAAKRVPGAAGRIPAGTALRTGLGTGLGGLTGQFAGTGIDNAAQLAGFDDPRTRDWMGYAGALVGGGRGFGGSAMGKAMATKAPALAGLAGKGSKALASTGNTAATVLGMPTLGASMVQGGVIDNLEAATGGKHNETLAQARAMLDDGDVVGASKVLATIGDDPQFTGQLIAEKAGLPGMGGLFGELYQMYQNGDYMGMLKAGWDSLPPWAQKTFMAGAAVGGAGLVGQMLGVEGAGLATAAGLGAAGVGAVGGALQAGGAFDGGGQMIENGPFAGLTHEQAIQVIESMGEEEQAAPESTLSDDTLQRAS